MIALGECRANPRAGERFTGRTVHGTATTGRAVAPASAPASVAAWRGRRGGRAMCARWPITAPSRRRSPQVAAIRMGPNECGTNRLRSIPGPGGGHLRPVRRGRGVGSHARRRRSAWRVRGSGGDGPGPGDIRSALEMICCHHDPDRVVVKADVDEIELRVRGSAEPGDHRVQRPVLETSKSPADACRDRPDPVSDLELPRRRQPSTTSERIR